MKPESKPIPSKARVRKHLNGDVLFKAVKKSFEHIKDPFGGVPKITLPDALMSAFAMFSLKSSSLLAFDRIRMAEEHNLKSIYGIGQIPCDTQMRTRLDEVNPDSIRSAHKTVLRNIQRGKVLEKMVFMEGHYLVSIDGTGYFSSEKLFSPSCLEKKSSKTGKSTYYLQTLGAAIVHPGRKEVLALPPEPIRKQDGQDKNDCERNACRRWLHKFRQDHPHLKVIIVEDGLSPNAPHIRDLKEYRCRFILGLKEGDHAYLSACLDQAVADGEAVEHDVADEKEPAVHHFFRFANGIPLNESNKDLLVNVLEYWEVKGNNTKHFCWVTDFTITRQNAYQIMRGGRARWKIENETFNTLKNQGYHLEHNYGLGKKHLSMVFVSLMMLAFLVDQTQQMTCSLFRSVWKKVGTKRELWESIRGAFRLFIAQSMEALYRRILAGAQEMDPVIIDTS
jgi:hypothetical protein